MKKHLFTIIIALIFVVGLSVLLYPTVADFINSFRQSRVVAQFYSDVQTMAEEDFEEFFEAAHEWNEALKRRENRFVYTESQHEEYLSMLSPFDSGVIGTLTIDVIDVRLPLYVGTSETVLQRGVGHMEGTTLPIGGPGTHAVISGHRGLPSSTLLTNLDRVEIDDIFVLRVLNRTLTYQIDQIVVVEPHEIGELAIDPSMDYVSLVTCTPYGINSHRMLLRGVRIPNEEIVSEQQVYTTTTNVEVFDGVIVAALLGSLFIVIVAGKSLIMRLKTNKRR